MAGWPGLGALTSARDEAAAQAWLEDRYTGPA
jgi:hypothetical protein